MNVKGGKRNRTSGEWRTVNPTLRVEKRKQKGERVTKDDKSLDGGVLDSTSLCSNGYRK
jgi:hypothetical protein